MPHEEVLSGMGSDSDEFELSPFNSESQNKRKGVSIYTMLKRMELDDTKHSQEQSNQKAHEEQ